MRVAFFSDTYLPQINGVSKTIARLRNYLRSNGIESIVLIPETGIRNNDKEVYCFRSYRLPFYPELKLAIPTEKEVNIILSKFQPDIVHLVTEFTMGYSGLRWAQRNNIPIASSYHTNFADYAAYYNYPFLSHLFWYYLIWFHNQSHINFCPSHETLEILKSKGINNLLIWGRGVDGEFFNPFKRKPEFRKNFGINADEIALLYVGRIAPEKSIDILFDAFKIVKKIFSNIKLIIAGSGPSESFYKSLNIPDIIFTGELDQEKLSILYASSDIFTFPSTSETYGNVVLEAMSSGLPVVAPFCGGIKENLKDGFNGISYKSNSPEDMANAIIKLINNKNMRKIFSINARKHAETRIWNQTMSVVLKGYYNCINNTKVKLA